MSHFLHSFPDKKTSQAMARCILLGVSGVVGTYLIWKTVQFYAIEIPVSFHLTCGLVEGVILLATATALYRLSISNPGAASEKSMKGRGRSMASAKKSLVVPMNFSKTELAWFERN